jgi:hypothetical protein
VSGLLGNLKILDLVARHAIADGAVDTTGWVGESSIADWFWTAEVERGTNPIARGAFARQLAQKQADQLLASVPVDAFPVADLAPLESLTIDRVCVKAPGDRLAFDHDLFGDWARLRILLNHRNDLSIFLRERSASPLWHRAIRLLGVHLVEQEGGVDEWRKAIGAFASDEPGAVHDLLLEAPVFAANAAEVLEAIFPDLMAHGGALLRRMLTRFLAFATIPDTEKLVLARAVKVDASFVRAKYRIPYWPFWLDVLRALHAHRTEVLAIAPAEVARVVEMWLSFVEPGGVLRHETAELGVLIGRWALERRDEYRGRDWEEDRQRFYKCALAAAPEFPDEVAQIALIASERVEPPRDTDSGEPVRPRRRSRGLFPGPSTPLKPWPDGPNQRVDDAFQAVVLDSTAILELFRIRPAVAREVVLATLIEPPNEGDWSPGSLRRSELDFVKRLRWHPALYTQGPFLAFLNADFSEGLPLIVRLIDFATSRERHYASRDVEEWGAQALADGQPQAAVDEAMRASAPVDLVITVGTESRAFVGDERTYGWSAGLGNPPEAVQACLMALEQYFYMRLDNDVDIRADVAAALVQSTTVALLGVLCDVGKRHPALFEGPLRLLLAAPELYTWEITKNVHGRGHLMIFGLNRDQLFMRAAQTFHDQPHRRIDLRRLATLLLIRSSVSREYLASVVATWREIAASAASRVSDMRERMILTLDIANYEERDDPEDGRVLINTALERAQEATSGEREAMNERMLIMGFPMRCRRLLDEGRPLSVEELEELWRQWERVRELAANGSTVIEEEQRFGDEFSNAIAGGTAVLLAQEALWGPDASRRNMALDTLAEILKNPPARSAFDSRDSVSDWSWDCFCAETVAEIWARDPSNIEWRTLVANMVFAPHYKAVERLFARCAERRALLGTDFSRLRRLALEWAYVSDRAELLRHVPREVLKVDVECLQTELTSWHEERVAAFVSGSLGTMPGDWMQCDDRVRFAALDAFRAQWHREEALDLHLVRSAHQWGPLPERASNEDERREWLQFWRSALLMVLKRPRTAKGGNNHYPDDNERWVLEGVALILLQLRPGEDAGSLWCPIIDLAGEWHNWPEVFLRDFHAHALTADPTPASYVPLVRGIVERAFVEIDGKPRWRSFEEVWQGLLGMDGFAQRLWELRHAPLVAELADVIAYLARW